MGQPSTQKVAFFAVAFATVVFVLSAHYLSIFQRFRKPASHAIRAHPKTLARDDIDEHLLLLPSPSPPSYAPTWRLEVHRMVRDEETRRLYEYVKWALSKPPSVTCKDRLLVGMNVGTMDQEPYSICFDPPFELTRGNCLVYSFGIADQWYFEDQIASQYQCEVYAFDPSMNLEDNHTRESGLIKFFKIGLWSEDTIYVPNGNETYQNKNPGNWTMRTLQSIVKLFGHENRMIDVLKVDIEGAEAKSFLTALKDGFLQHHVGTIALEWHVWFDNIRNEPEIVDILTAHEELVDAGFELFHWAPRNLMHGYFPLESYVNKELYVKKRSPFSSTTMMNN